MTPHDDQLEPIDPSTARELYLDHKATHCAEATVRAHHYRTKHIVDWCDENGIDNLNDLTGRNLHEFRLWHMERDDINQLTLRQHMCTLRVFLKWAASIEAVPANLYDKVMVPQVGRDERRSDETLDADSAGGFWSICPGFTTPHGSTQLSRCCGKPGFVLGVRMRLT